MEKFYQSTFYMRTVWRRENDKAYLTTGNNDILALLKHTEFENKNFDLKQITKHSNKTPNFPHFGVIVDSEDEFEHLLQWMKSSGVEIVGPKVSRDTTKSFYIFDPEQNCVQIVLPPQKYFLSK